MFFNFKISIHCIACKRAENALFDLPLGATVGIQCKKCKAWMCYWVVVDCYKVQLKEDGVYQVSIY